MAWTVEDLLKQSQQTLDDLFREAQPGPIPDGEAKGTAIIAPGTSFTEEIAQLRGAFRIDQFVRLGNSRAHELHTGPEIYDACAGSLTAFCDFVGTGGSFAGLSKAFKARNPAIKAYVVEPAGAAVLQGERASRPNHRIQGGGYGIAELGLLKDIKIDGFLTVGDEEAIDAARRLAREEGIFAGFSSGANVAAALKLLKGPEQGGTIVVLICDSGLKYLSTDLWP